MKTILSLFAGLLLETTLCAQPCNCPATYTWLRETFENNDAGFQYVIDQKGAEAYAEHCAATAGRVTQITEKPACAEELLAWLHWFRTGHIWFGATAQNSGNTPTDTAAIRALYSNAEKFDFDEAAFTNFASKLKQPEFEGIWESEPYKIGIKKVGNEYIGFVMEADGVYWTKGQVKFKIQASKNTATYYMQDHSPRQFTDVKLLGDNYLQMGFITLKRVLPQFEADKEIDRDFAILNATYPLYEQLDANTALLRIPAFDHTEKPKIDSVVAANWKGLTTTENLIIDLRNNGGGSDVSYQEIMPLLYTNPVRTVGVEMLSTPLNNQRMEQFVKDPAWGEEGQKWAAESLKKLNAHLSEFVNLDSTDVTVETQDTIYPFPSQVGILIHEGNGSTTEQFLLAAKQSTKVKLFGTTTLGVLDISNMHFIKSPCGDYELGYCLSRSLRIPDMTIDGKGIQPDFYLDSSVPSYKWIDFARQTLNGER